MKETEKKKIKDIREVLAAIAKDPRVRQSVARENHLMFFLIYLPHYVTHHVAGFQKDIFRITEIVDNKLTCIVAFRGSGKSTLITLSYALWAILGKHQKKFVLIIGRTQAQARQYMLNLRSELEGNKLLRSDMGPFQEETGGEWAMSSLVFKNTRARIMVASVDQSVRGLRHNEHRPDLIILDDIEDLNSARTMEGRNKTYDWFTREIVPLGDIHTRIMLVGNLLHEDSLMMRLQANIEKGEQDGIYKWFPLLNKNGYCLWPEKFDTPEKIEALRRTIGNELAWRQEYLLEIISDATRVVFPEWIQRYDVIPRPVRDDNAVMFTAVDLAISLRESADYTAMVSAEVHGYGKNLRIYILPNPENSRMPYPDILRKIHELHDKFSIRLTHSLFIENVQAQEYLVQQLKLEKIPAKGVNPGSNDKRTRIALTSEAIRSGIVLFPKQGADLLIMQLIGFVIERHDDLADAFAILVNNIILQRPQRAVFDISGGRGGTIAGNPYKMQF